MFEGAAGKRKAKADAVGLYKLSEVDPDLESAWFEPLSLSSENLVSKSRILNSNLYRYNAAESDSDGMPALCTNDEDEGDSRVAAPTLKSNKTKTAAAAAAAAAAASKTAAPAAVGLCTLDEFDP
jgi:hypothetical protein